MAQTYDLLGDRRWTGGLRRRHHCGRRRRHHVCLIDRATPPGQRPGETLHPGAVPLLERLGIGGAIAAGRFVRVPGIAMVTEAGCRFEAYGADNSGPWCGVQVPGRNARRPSCAGARRSWASMSAWAKRRCDRSLPATG